MRDTVYLFVFDGAADHEVALALTEIRRPGAYRLRTVATAGAGVELASGLHLRPDMQLHAIDPARAVLALLPGGLQWLRGDGAPIVQWLPRLLAAGVPLAAIGTGTLALARAGLLDRRRHTGNRRGHIDAFVPGYRGAAHYQADLLAASDAGVITASGLAPVEFAREVIGVLDLYDGDDLRHWYRLFKHAQPPPWLADAPALA